MLRIFLSGGIGNRLFQLAFARVLKEKFFYKISIEQIDCKSSSQDLNVETILGAFLDPVARVSVSRTLKVHIDPWRTFSPNFVWGKRYDFRYVSDFSNVDLSRFSSNGHIVGYFQDMRFVNSLEEQMTIELKSFLDKRNNQFVSTPYEIIHVRGGDYKKNSNRELIGELSSSYYSEILMKKSPIQRICLTDDLDFAREKLRRIYVDNFMGPKDISVIRALYLMQNATRLICANSTFSWWGGVLARNISGAEVLIPNPFFKSYKLGFGKGLLHPRFLSKRSIFEI